MTDENITVDFEKEIQEFKEYIFQNKEKINWITKPSQSTYRKNDKCWTMQINKLILYCTFDEIKEIYNYYINFLEEENPSDDDVKVFKKQKEGELSSDAYIKSASKIRQISGAKKTAEEIHPLIMQDLKEYAEFLIGVEERIKNREKFYNQINFCKNSLKNIFDKINNNT